MLDALRQFIEQTVWPREGDLLQMPWAAARPQLEAWRAALRQRGLWLPPMPQEWSGQGLSLLEFAPISEVLGTSPFGHWLVNCQAPDISNMELLHAQGTPEQQERWLRPLTQGDMHSCFAMTEPEHAGSNPTWLDTRARLDGNEYVIDGHKWFTTAADGAAFAIVMAVTDPDAEPHHRASLIIVPTDTPGFSLVRNLPVMGDSGSGPFSHAEVRFDNCRVPLSYRIGESGGGFALAQQRLGPGRIHHCMRWIGVAERSLDLMCRRAASRELAPGRPLALQPVVQGWLAESRADIDACRLLVLDTARTLHRSLGSPPSCQGGRGSDRERISLIKFHVAAMLQRVLDRAIQVHGALGLTDELPLAFWYRHERGARIYDGPDEVHKIVVARSMLKRYGVSID